MPGLKILQLRYATFRMTNCFTRNSSLETRSLVIPSAVEESYARPRDPSTALRYVQDDKLFFSKL